MPLAFFDLTPVEWIGDIARERTALGFRFKFSSALSWVVLGGLLNFFELWFPYLTFNLPGSLSMPREIGRYMNMSVC